MKKILIIILVLFIGMYMFYNMNKKEDNNITNNFEEDRYMFISYIDYSYLKGKDENSLKEEIDKIDLLNTTPMDALKILFDLKSKSKDIRE